MTVVGYLIKKLIEYQVTDSFGIPGGVILDFLYEQYENGRITPHLMSCEQSCGFAACGYSHASGKLGVAYATRGPGFTNLITCIAEAYQESLPVLFITAHAEKYNSESGIIISQELDTIELVDSIVKYCAVVEDGDNAKEVIDTACYFALEGKKGPVFLDFKSSVWNAEIEDNNCILEKVEKTFYDNSKVVIDRIKKELDISNRPVVLVGDGIRHSCKESTLKELIYKSQIPFLSSRGSQDLFGGYESYYGYIGSHGLRYSNYIISKSDLIIVLGNRLAFPIDSQSFSEVFNNKKVIRIDIDKHEVNRRQSEAESYHCDVSTIISEIVRKGVFFNRKTSWIEICNKIRKELDDCDVSKNVLKITDYLDEDGEKIYISDVGTHSFLLSRAFEKKRCKGTLLCSKSFSPVGSSVGKSIGAYYALNKPIDCIIGDQGFQYDIQELEYIKSNNIPVKIIIINNNSLGMISDIEEKKYCGKKLHVNKETGYTAPDFNKVVIAFGIDFLKNISDVKAHSGPCVCEIDIDDSPLNPYLPQGRLCYDMEPRIDETVFEMINGLL